MGTKELITITNAIIGSFIGLIALIKGLLEYVKQGTTKRAEIFINMRKRLPWTFPSKLLVAQ